MLTNIFIFIAALYLVINGSTMATKYAARLAGSFRLSKYTIGFIIVAIISILPETFIAINSALEGVPSFGLGVLFGSNIADLTLVFVIIVLYAGRSLTIESKILKIHTVYPFLLLLPVVLGLDGHFSRFEGMALIIVGAVFYYITLRNGTNTRPALSNGTDRYKSIFLLLTSMGVLLLGAHFTVVSVAAVAQNIGINPIVIGMLIVGLGTTMPELFFSLNSVKRRDDSLAIGDLFGTVLADATVVVGILAMVSPFAFPQKIIYITGSFMVLSSFILFRFMRSGRTLTRREVYMLSLLWLAFVIVEFVANR